MDSKNSGLRSKSFRNTDRMHPCIYIYVLFSIFYPKYTNPEQEEEGRKRYEAQKLERQETKARLEEAMPPPPNPGIMQPDILC